jgi:protein CpxP
MSLKFKFISVLAVGGAIAVFSGASLAQDTTTAPQGVRAGHHHRGGDGEGRRGPGGREGMRGGDHGGFGGLMKGVNLTDAQKAQIKQIREANKPNTADFEQIRSLMEARRNGTLTDDQKAQLKAFHEARQAKEESVRQQIEAILTPEQKAQIEKNKADMKARREEFKEKRQEWRKDRQDKKSSDSTTTSKPGIN